MGDRYECAPVGKESVDKIAASAQPVLSFGNCGACRAKLVPNRRPQLLPCLHSLCLQCVPQARGVSEGECPVCSEAFFPKNVTCDPFHMDSLCSPAKPASKCGGCGGLEVGGWCMECADQLCPVCIFAHQRVKVTRTHSVLLLHDPHMAPAPMLYCSVHRNEIARLFCESCDKPICPTCRETLHWSHRVSSLELVPGNERAAIQPLLEDLEQQRNAVKRSLSDLDRRLLDLNEMQAKLKGDVHDMILHIRDALMKHAMSLSLRVQELCDMETRRVLERREALRKLKEQQSYLLSFGKRALDPDGTWALSSCGKKLREQLVDIVSNDVSPGTTMLTALLCFDGDVCSKIKAIGKLVVRDVPFACTNHQINVDTPLPRHSHKIQSPNSRVVPSTQTASTSSPNILALRSSCQISQICPNVTLIPPTPSQIPPISLQIQPTSCQIPPNTAQIPSTSFWIPTTSCQIPPTSLQIRPNAAQIPPSSSRIPASSWQIQPNAVQNPPTSSCRILPTSLQIQSNAIQTPPTSSLIPTTSCQILPTSLLLKFDPLLLGFLPLPVRSNPMLYRSLPLLVRSLRLLCRSNPVLLKFLPLSFRFLPLPVRFFLLFCRFTQSCSDSSHFLSDSDHFLSDPSYFFADSTQTRSDSSHFLSDSDHFLSDPSYFFRRSNLMLLRFLPLPVRSLPLPYRLTLMRLRFLTHHVRFNPLSA
ncbi:hypothetical protein GJAV_G00102590 [Gymnothorax javanicus]|nr:hypothetical protein GJAV_G00102590 [Gymnothorax javanicus]